MARGSPASSTPLVLEGILVAVCRTAPVGARYAVLGKYLTYPESFGSVLVEKGMAGFTQLRIHTVWSPD